MNCHIIYNYKLAQGLITGISDVRIMLFLNPVITVICPIYPKMHTKRLYNSLLVDCLFNIEDPFAKLYQHFIYCWWIHFPLFLKWVFLRAIAIHYIDFVGLEPRTFKS